MGPREMEKFQSMKKRCKRRSFLQSFLHCVLKILLLGLFSSCPLWLPKVLSIAKFVRFVFLPSVQAVVFGPKCIFLVCNIIVVFLIGESKRSPSSEPVVDVYDEYMEEKRKNLRTISNDEGKEKKKLELQEPAVLVVPLAEEMHKEVVIKEEEEEEVEEEEEDLDFDQEESGLPADELNKRVEDFIARVNEQRRMEARLLFCRF